MSDSKVYKVTFVMDEDWYKQFQTWLEFADEQEDEIMQVVSVEEVTVCEDCRTYKTNENEVVMEVFACPDNRGYCLNCCGCEDHNGEKWY